MQSWRNINDKSIVLLNKKVIDFLAENRIGYIVSDAGIVVTSTADIDELFVCVQTF